MTGVRMSLDKTPHLMHGPQKIEITVDGKYTTEDMAKLLYELGKAVKKILKTDDYSVGFGDLQGN